MSLAAQFAERHKRFHAEIARKAAELKTAQRYRPVPRSYIVPNKPFGEPKVRSIYVAPVEFYWREMWFYDLVFQGSPKFRKLDIKLIQEMVAAHYRIRVADLVSERRTADIVKPRQIAMHLCRKMTPRSYPDIGRRFGGKDHTTILHADKKVIRSIASNPEFAAEVAEIEARIASAT
jgi:hypothetical protein